MGKYINNNFKVYNSINKELVLWKDFTGTEFISNFVGMSEIDFFNKSTKGIGHYNGIDYVTIYPSTLEINAIKAFDKEIFFEKKKSDNRHYIIIQGTLKE